MSTITYGLSSATFAYRETPRIEGVTASAILATIVLMVVGAIAGIALSNPAMVITTGSCTVVAAFALTLTKLYEAN